MDFINIDVMKKQIDVIYSDINKLRTQMDQVKKKRDKKALSRLVSIGSRVKKSAGDLSTKKILDDVRG